MIEWCFTPLLTAFQSYYDDSSHYSCLPRFHQYLAGALKCLAQGHSHEKNPEDPVWLKPRTMDCESNTLPLSHAGPL